MICRPLVIRQKWVKIIPGLVVVGLKATWAICRVTAWWYSANAHFTCLEEVWFCAEAQAKHQIIVKYEPLTRDTTWAIPASHPLIHSHRMMRRLATGQEESHCTGVKDHVYIRRLPQVSTGTKLATTTRKGYNKNCQTKLHQHIRNRARRSPSTTSGRLHTGGKKLSQIKEARHHHHSSNRG
jgi:hypothetical protein